MHFTVVFNDMNRSYCPAARHLLLCEKVEPVCFSAFDNPTGMITGQRKT